MGQFSWLDCKTGEQILDNVERTSYLLIPKEFGGGHLVEKCYDGYGHFAGRDAYALVAQWNRPEACFGNDEIDRHLGIELYYKYPIENLKYFIKVTHDPKAIYEMCGISEDDPNQGWLMEEDEVEEDWY